MSTYASDVAVAEGTRQDAHKTATTKAQHDAADVAYRLALVTIGRTYGVRNGAAQAIINNHETPPAQSWQPGDA
jgi:hypothetical protein